MSENDGQYFMWCTDLDAMAGNDTLFLVKNTTTGASRQSLLIHKLTVSHSVDTEVTVHKVTAGITPAGTTVTPVALSPGNPTSPLGDDDAKSDETNNSQGSVLLGFQVLASTPYTYEFDPPLVIGEGHCFAVDVVAAGNGIATVVGSFV